jgi:hypothetical protein
MGWDRIRDSAGEKEKNKNTQPEQKRNKNPKSNQRHGPTRLIPVREDKKEERGGDERR